MTSFATLTFLQGFGNASLKATGNDTNGTVPVCISVNESLFYFICTIALQKMYDLIIFSSFGSSTGYPAPADLSKRVKKVNTTFAVVIP